MGPTALLPLRRKVASAGFEPANLGTKGQHATPRPPKPQYTHKQPKCTSLFTMYFNHTFLTDMLRWLLRLSSGWNYYNLTLNLRLNNAPNKYQHSTPTAAHISPVHLYVSLSRYYDKPNIEYFHILNSSKYSRDISIVKLTRCTNVSNLFYFMWGNNVHVLDGLSVHHQEIKTVHTATDICQKDTVKQSAESSRQYLFDIGLLLYVLS